MKNWVKYLMALAALMFLIGALMSGRLSMRPEAIMQESAIEKVYNFTDCPSFEDMQIYASFHNKVLMDGEEFKRQKEEIKELHQENRDEMAARKERDLSELNKLYDSRKDEAEKITHRAYQRGYQEGYRDGRGR